MYISKRSKIYFYISLLLGIVVGCQKPPVDDGNGEIDKNHPLVRMVEWLSQPQFGGDYWKSFNFLCPDSTAARIKREVPLEWQTFVLEGAYYKFDNITYIAQLPDALKFEVLDTYDKVFEPDSIKAFTQMIRGELFIQLAQYDTALLCLKDAYNISIKNHNMIRAADVNGVLARWHLHQNDYPEAIRLLLEMETVYSGMDSYTEKGRKVNSYNALGKAYQAIRNYEESYRWFRKTWDYAMQTVANPASTNGFRMYAYEAAVPLAEAALYLNRWEEAKSLIDTTFYFQARFHRQNLAPRSLVYGKILMAAGDYKKALPQLLEARVLHKDLTNQAVTQRYNKALGEGYQGLGQLDSAIFYYKMAATTPDTTDQILVLDALSLIYAQKGLYNQAYAYEHQSKMISNRAFTSDKDEAIGRLQSKQAMDKREREFAEAEHQEKLMRIWLLTGLIMVCLGYWVVYLWVKQKRQTWKVAEQKQQLLSQEKELLLQEAQRLAQETLLLAQEKELAEARALLQAQELNWVRHELGLKEEDLLVSKKLISLKNLLIQELEMKLKVQTEVQIEASSHSRDLPTGIEDAKSVKPEGVTRVLKTTELSNLKILTSEDWRNFRGLFDQCFPTFFEQLTLQYPKLTDGEIRLFLLLKVGFDTVEVANVLGITTSSVYKNRYRLRKKLGLDEEGDLEKFVVAFG